MPSRSGQDNVLDPTVVRAWLACDESPDLEPIDQTGDVRVVAGQSRGELVHRQSRVQLQEGARLGGVQVELGGRRQKSPPLLGKQSA